MGRTQGGDLVSRRLTARVVALCSAGLLIAFPAAPASGGPTGAGWQTDEPPMLTALAPGSSVQPIITVGETLPGGYLFESIPDGISIVTDKHKRTEILLNHETSTEPFPEVTFPNEPTQTNPALTFADFTDSLVSRLELKQHEELGVGVKKGSYAIGDEANFQRFCSNFLATETEGFDRPLFFTNEESSDFVYRSGQAWRGPYSPSSPPPGTEQAGLVVAMDPASGAYRTIYGMGRHNHENSVPVPGYGHPVLLSGDDTFTAPSSQLYMYTAEDADAVWNDEGALWAFSSTEANDYGDLTAASDISGEFIPVPRSVAVGDQNALENWSNENNVFQFIRVEDIAYDRNDPFVVYFADTGEPRAIADPATGRLQRGPSGTEGPYPNGRIFRMEFDPSDPTVVESLTVLIDADAGGYRNPGVVHQPDNLETTANSILIQEDPGAHNNESAAFPNATNARIWRYDFGSGGLTPVAEVDQSADPAAAAGSWESSGIIDASGAFGPHTFLVDVQAHSLFIESEQQDVYGDSDLDVTVKREGGQLLLLRIPGA